MVNDLPLSLKAKGSVDFSSKVDLRNVNSATKYPSIPTYHTLDPKNGKLSEPAVQFTGTVLGTEKVDGTNSRIIIFPNGDFLIGSREELLTMRGDRVFNDKLGIVENLRTLAFEAADFHHTHITTYYLELYGGRIGGEWRNYTHDPNQFGWRLFDVSVLSNSEVLDWTPERIASWREHGGQSFYTEAQLANVELEIPGMRLVNLVFEEEAESLPQALEDTYKFLQDQLPRSQSVLSGEASAKPEGIVLRSPDRSTIAKARFQDYERTFRKDKGKRN